MLYPLKFRPVVKPKIWGQEVWALSAQGDVISVVENGFLADNDLKELIEVYMGDMVGDKVFETFGTDFPLLFKFITANDKLSVQVHPDDEYAWQHHHSLGKAEMWFVTQAKPQANIILGLNHELTKEQMREYLQQNTLQEVLNHVSVNRNDVVVINPGTIHSLGAGVSVAEIQQSSDITYRLYDFDRRDANGNPRELHIEQALDVAQLKPITQPKVNYTETPNGAVNLHTCSYFTTNLLTANRTIIRDYTTLDSFVVLLCTEGQVKIKTAETDEEVALTNGEVCLLPATTEEVSFITDTNTKLLEVYIDQL